MIQRLADDLATMYEADETAWLETMADLIRQGRLTDLDYAHLQEYLEDMAARDRREVKSRLTRLLCHFLKWDHQPDQRTRSWSVTIAVQSRELADLAQRGVLRNHAEAILAAAYADAVREAALETGLPRATFPAVCPHTLEQLLAPDILGLD
jgi:hypothetical protein